MLGLEMIEKKPVYGMAKRTGEIALSTTHTELGTNGYIVVANDDVDPKMTWTVFEDKTYMYYHSELDEQHRYFWCSKENAQVDMPSNEDLGSTLSDFFG